MEEEKQKELPLVGTNRNIQNIPYLDIILVVLFIFIILLLAFNLRKMMDDTTSCVQSPLVYGVNHSNLESCFCSYEGGSIIVTSEGITELGK